MVIVVFYHFDFTCCVLSNSPGRKFTHVNLLQTVWFSVSDKKIHLFIIWKPWILPCFIFPNRSTEGCHSSQRIHSANVCRFESWQWENNIFAFHLCNRYFNNFTYFFPNMLAWCTGTHEIDRHGKYQACLLCRKGHNYAKSFGRIQSRLKHALRFMLFDFFFHSETVLVFFF